MIKSRKLDNINLNKHDDKLIKLYEKAVQDI